MAGQQTNGQGASTDDRQPIQAGQSTSPTNGDISANVPASSNEAHPARLNRPGPKPQSGTGGTDTLGTTANSDGSYSVRTTARRVDARGAVIDAGLTAMAGAGVAGYAAKRYLSRRSTTGDGSAVGATSGWHGLASSAANKMDGVDPNKQDVSVKLDQPFEYGESWSSRANKVNKAAQAQGMDVAGSTAQAAASSLIGNGAIRSAAEKIAGKRNVQAIVGNGSVNAVSGRQMRREAKADVKAAKRAARRARASQIAANMKAIGPGGSMDDWRVAQAANSAASAAAAAARGKAAAFKAADNRSGVRGVVHRGASVLGNKVAKPMASFAGNMGLRGANWARGKALGLANSAAAHAVHAARAIADAFVRTIKRISAIAKNIIHTIIFLFTPPQVIVVAIVCGLIVVTLNVITIKQTFGPSDVDCADVSSSEESDTASKGNSSDAGTVQMNEGATAVAKAFQKAGFSKAATAAAMGVMQWESGGYNPTATNPSSGAYGFEQWLGGRLTNLQNFAAQQGKDKSDPSVQADFIIKEVRDASSWILVDSQYGARKSDMMAKYPGIKTDAAGIRSEWATVKGDDDGLTKGVRVWLYSFARPGVGEEKEEQRIDYAKQFYKLLDGVGGSWGADGSMPSDLESGGSSSSSSSSNSSTADKCESGKGGNGKYGDIGGAKECDAGKCAFDWMCDAIGVCKDGDYGNDKSVYAHGEYGYQCVWYAWNRASMVYGTQGWTWVSGNGGDIWANAQGTPGWTVDTTPHPGDIISGHGAPFAGSTHVAFVEKVEPDASGWKIYISEGNYSPTEGNGGYHGYHTRWMTKTEALTGDNHFLRHDSWKSKQGL